MAESDKVGNGHVAEAVFQSGVRSQMRYTQWILGLSQLLFIILFAGSGGSQIASADQFGYGNTTAIDGYNYYIGVMIMMIVGFGYLMTFLKNYGLGAVGFCLLVSAIGLQWGLFIEAFFSQMYNKSFGPVPLDIYAILNVTSNIAAPLISLGAVIGKVSPLQLVVMVLLEFAAHAFNVNILMAGMLKVADIGGTYSDHMFGCYFGLAVAYCMGKPAKEPAGGDIPDVFSLVGTAFLWIYWPSFVAGFSEVNSDQQQRALTNTIFCLCASTVTAFWGSSFFNTGSAKFRPVDIQNATLAGGVAIGCVANLPMSPVGSLLIGTACGLLSTFGYARVQPYLLERFGLHDTCGINNLHGMPSLLGGFISVFLAARENVGSGIYLNNNNSVQATCQFFGILICFGFAIGTGLVTGVIMRMCAMGDSGRHEKFNDAVWWELCGDDDDTTKAGPAALSMVDDDDVKDTSSPFHQTA